jgi:hypothetical protein
MGITWFVGWFMGLWRFVGLRRLVGLAWFMGLWRLVGLAW